MKKLLLKLAILVFVLFSYSCFNNENICNEQNGKVSLEQYELDKEVLNCTVRSFMKDEYLGEWCKFYGKDSAYKTAVINVDTIFYKPDKLMNISFVIIKYYHNLVTYSFNDLKKNRDEKGYFYDVECFISVKDSINQFWNIYSIGGIGAQTYNSFKSFKDAKEQLEKSYFINFKDYEVFSYTKFDKFKHLKTNRKARSVDGAEFYKVGYNMNSPCIWNSIFFEKNIIEDGYYFFQSFGRSQLPSNLNRKGQRTKMLYPDKLLDKYFILNGEVEPPFYFVDGNNVP